jgi:Icc-related predicted phosphoesterase
MKLLSVSDVEMKLINSPVITLRFRDVDLLISCGDISYYYLEYVISMLNIPAYFVRGNHAKLVEYGSAGERTSPWGAIDLHKRCIRDKSGLLLAGIEGSVRYKPGSFQYTQGEMWWHVWLLAVSMFLNRLRYGRFLDIFVSHAPAWEVHDAKDLPHQGIKAFRWLIKVFQPAIHLHGHMHVYHPDTVTRTQVNNTHVINSYRFSELTFDMKKIDQRPIELT